MTTDGSTSAAAAADTPRRPDTRDPRQSRHRALKVLFTADLRGEDANVALDRVLASAEAVALLDEADLDDLDLDAEDRSAAATVLARPPTSRRLDGYAQRLVRGVAEHRAELDDLIQQRSKGWKLERMPLVDRNVLRIAIYEMLHEDVRPAIAIDEAVELAKQLSSDDAPRFINGVLEAVRRHHIGDATR